MVQTYYNHPAHITEYTVPALSRHFANIFHNKARQPWWEWGKCRHSEFSNMGGMIVICLDHVTFSMTFSITFSIGTMLSCPLCWFVYPQIDTTILTILLRTPTIVDSPYPASGLHIVCPNARLSQQSMDFIITYMTCPIHYPRFSWVAARHLGRPPERYGTELIHVFNAAPQSMFTSSHFQRACVPIARLRLKYKTNLVAIDSEHMTFD
jgi:hypothetical protein